MPGPASSRLIAPSDPTGPPALREAMTATSPLLRPTDRIYDGYVFDLDGTVYLGDALLPGASEVIAAIRARGCRTVFLSNNPTRDPQMYADKLGGLGIPTPVTDIVTRPSPCPAGCGPTTRTRACS